MVNLQEVARREKHIKGRRHSITKKIIKGQTLSKQHNKSRHVSANTVTWSRIKMNDIKKDKKHNYVPEVMV